MRLDVLIQLVADAAIHILFGNRGGGDGGAAACVC
jgi:hypothetical protein